jgi:hypothetical protein
MYLGIADYLNSRAHGVRYDLVAAPSGAVTPGSAVDYRIKVINRGNVASSGWQLVLGSVPAPAPAVAGDWLVKSDITLSDNSRLSTIGVAPLQVELATN